jgi:CheY-like chemotaxis protein
MDRHIDANWVEHGYGTRFQGFQNLMKQRIRDILIVSSLYDLYLFEEDGRLYELIRNEYQGLQLSHAPELTRVSNGYEALSLFKDDKRFDLVVTTLHVEDMHPAKFAEALKEIAPETPVVLLAFDNRELADLLRSEDVRVFEKVFIWQGDFRLVIGIIKYLEDRLNADHDTNIVGVQSIIVVEDNIRFYSAYLPIIYTELIKQSKRLISEGINLSHRYLRMRARPKILLCETFEEALDYFDRFEEHILGVISDIDFERNGKPDKRAGVEFAREVRSRRNDVPVLLQSTSPEYELEARQIGASFLLKGSPTLMHDLRQFMINHFSFGDFVFRTPDGTEVGRAADLREMEEQLKIMPEESVKFHAERNHFSNWFKARTEFWLAEKVRPKRVNDYGSLRELRQGLLATLRDYRSVRQRGLITDFQKDTFDPAASFARVGGGSLGGKARGLGFLNILVNNYGVRDKFPGVRIAVPTMVVLGTDVFDQFLDDNRLRSFALECEDDAEIRTRFLHANKFSEDAIADLMAFLDLVNEPLAVRSSSLLEDSQYHPFAGVYATHMIPNNNPDPFIRLRELVNAIKLVYASTYYAAARDYIGVTSYRLEEEKMAVIVQKTLGSKHGDRFYPDFSGVAKSYNFYPVPPQKAEDGAASVALGLGKMIVEGGVSKRFCPKYPTSTIERYSPEEEADLRQTDFYALDLNPKEISRFDEEAFLVREPLAAAEEDGTLGAMGSTYSPENDAIYDGVSRPGVRLVTFAPILKHKIFPLPEILELILGMGGWGMGTPVEIEFAVNLSTPPGESKEFGLLQMRPMVVGREAETSRLEELDRDKALCFSRQTLGNGVVEDVRHLLVVDREAFNRAKSRAAAAEVGATNKRLVAEKIPYALVGPGRWGTLDPWLGIPIVWSQIAGAKAIVEAGLKDVAVKPSQGSHFFQNITSFGVGYFTVGDHGEESFVDWDWIKRQEPIESGEFVRLYRFDEPLTIMMNAREKTGAILKPGE